MFILNSASAFEEEKKSVVKMIFFLGKRKKGVVKLFENCDLTILGWFHEKNKT